MTRRARNLVLACLAAAVAGVAALFVWLPWNPLEAPAADLARWVPATCDLVIRLDVGGLLDAPLLRRLDRGPAGAALRRVPEVAEFLAEVAAADERLAEIAVPGGAVTLARDLVSGEALLAAAGDEVLAMTRISDRARSIALLSRAGDGLRARLGVTEEGGAFSMAAGDRRIAFATRRDVLLASTSKALLDLALALADGRAAPPPAADVPPVPRGAQAFVRGDGRRVAALVEASPLSSAELVRALAGRVRVDLDVTAASIVASVRCASPRPPLARVDDEAAAAARLAGDGAVAHGALPVSARGAVAALVDSQPESRRELLRQLLEDGGSSLDALVGDLARHLKDGAGFVVERLPAVDGLALDTPRGDAVEPLPATHAVLTLADPAGAEAFVADLMRHAAALFGDDARLADTVDEAGVRTVTAESAALGPEWRLFAPAVAIDGRTVIVTTNRDALRRALARGREGAAVAAPGETVAALRVSARELRKRLADLRWQHASQATYHDFAAERRALHAALLAADPPLPATALAEREEAEMNRRVAERDEREFPAALAEYLASLAWIDAFEGLDVRVRDGRSGLLADVAVTERAR